MAWSRRVALKALAWGCLAPWPAVRALARPRPLPSGGSFALTARLLLPRNDVADVRVLAPGTLLVTNGRVEAVLPGGAPISDRPAFRLDGAAILPGIINAHQHARFGQAERRERFLAHGVTGLGMPGCPLADMAVAMARDDGPSPDVALAGPVITVPGGYPIPSAGPAWAMTATNAREAGECVRRAADRGATLVKIAFEPGSPLRRYPVTTMDVARGAVGEARRLGMVTRCHAEDLSGLRPALEIGVDGVEHLACRWLEDGRPRPVLGPDDQPVPKIVRLYERMAQAGTILTPTLEVLRRTPWQAAVFPLLRAALDAGVPLALGNDYPFRRAQSGMPLAELGLMVEGGMTRGAVIHAATRNSAKVCGMADAGGLAPGNRADFLIVGGDPLLGLETLAAPLAVYKDGQRVA